MCSRPSTLQLPQHPSQVPERPPVRERLLGLTLQSERLLLRVPQVEMAQAILHYHLHNRAFLKPWNPIVRERFFDLEFQRKKIQSERVSIKRRQLLKFWFSRPQSPEQILGHVSLSNIVWGAFRSCFVGYSVDLDHNGQGLATEALGRVVEYAFWELGLHRIEANIMPRNRASIQVVEKLGFECEGRSPRYLKINGVWEDHFHYVMRNRAMEV